MLRWRRPTASEIAELRASEHTALTYDEVGATAGATPVAGFPAGYDHDAHRVLLGEGAGCFERACAALERWSHFHGVAWVEFHDGGEPASPGQGVVTTTRVLGMWFVSPCRVLYEERSAHRYAFGYGTLAGHPTIGEERFEVSLDDATGAVHYAISAFSRPASWWLRLGRPVMRRVQRRFALASGVALSEACADQTSVE